MRVMIWIANTIAALVEFLVMIPVVIGAIILTLLSYLVDFMNGD